MKSLKRLTAKPRSRREDALRRLFTYLPTPEGKAAIAKLFRAFRRKVHMSQTTLGEIIGICRQSVNEIENRRVYPHYTTIEKFFDLEERHKRERRLTAALRKRKPFWSKIVSRTREK